MGAFSEEALAKGDALYRASMTPVASAAPAQGDTMAGVTVGASQLFDQGLGESAAGLGRVLGSKRLEALGESRVAAGNATQQQAAEGHLQNPTDVRSVGDAIDVAQFAVGQQLPQIGTSLGAGAIGSKVLGAVGQRLAGPVGRTVGKVAGHALGAGLVNLSQMYGEARGDQRNAGLDNPEEAFKVGVANATIETAANYATLGTGRLLKLAGLNPTGRLATALMSIGINAPLQGATELAQEETQIRSRAALDPTYDPSGHDAVMRRINAAILGAVVSVPFAGVAGAVEGGGPKAAAAADPGIELPPGQDIPTTPGPTPFTPGNDLGYLDTQQANRAGVVAPEDIPDSEVPVDALGLNNPPPVAVSPAVQTTAQAAGIPAQDLPSDEPAQVAPPVQSAPIAAPDPTTPTAQATDATIVPLEGDPITWVSPGGEQRVVGTTPEGAVVVEASDKTRAVVPRETLSTLITADQAAVAAQPKSATQIAIDATVAGLVDAPNPASEGLRARAAALDARTAAQLDPNPASLEMQARIDQINRAAAAPVTLPDQGGWENADGGPDGIRLPDQGGWSDEEINPLTALPTQAPPVQDIPGVDPLASIPAVAPAPPAAAPENAPILAPPVATAPNLDLPTQLASEMARLRDVKPRPLNKLYGPNPTEAQIASHKAAMSAWDSQYRKVSKQQKAALAAANTPAPVASVAPTAQPAQLDIVTLTKEKYITEILKRDGVKKASPGYAAAKARADAGYGEKLDRALAALPFGQFNAHPENRESPEAVNRSAWEQLRAEFGITGDAPITPQAQSAATLPELEQLSKVDPYDNIESRPDSTAQQKALGRSALKDLFRQLTARYERSRRSGGKEGGNISLLGAAIYKDFVAGKPNQLVDQTITSTEDLAALAQVYRDPRYETLRAVFVDASGKVIAETAVSSRLPTSVAFEGSLESITGTLIHSGASGFYMLHNHPSGSSKPSAADKSMTKQWATFIPGFNGHVVIDHNEYSVVDRTGSAKTHKYDFKATDFKSNPVAPHDLLGKDLKYTQDVAKVAKALNQGDRAVMVFSTPEGKVSALTSLPMDMVMWAKGSMKRQKIAMAALRRMARANGADSNLSLVLPPGASTEGLKWLSKGFTSVIDHEGRTLVSGKARPFQDTINRKQLNESVAEITDGDQTNTVQFKKWFGDSKVVGENGKPLVVYHGTNGDISQFSAARGGEKTRAPSARMGFFFTNAPATASSYVEHYSPYDKGVLKTLNKATGNYFEKGVRGYFGMFGDNTGSVTEPVTGGNVMPVYLSMQNPMTYDMRGKAYREASYADIISAAKEEGHDGVIIRNTFDHAGYDGSTKAERSDIYVVFRPEQIKSATGNNGNFDANNPSILNEPIATIRDNGLTRAQNALMRKVSIGGTMVDRDTAIQRAVASGHKVVERNGQRALVSPDGSNTITEDHITRAGMDYAQHLIDVGGVQVAENRNAVGDPLPEEAKTVEDALTGKTPVEAAKWLSANAPSESDKLIASRVATQLQRLQEAGLDLTLNIAHVGDSVPRALLGSRGIAYSEYAKSKMTVWLNGADVAGKVGTSYETALHELVHAATMSAVRIGNTQKAAGTQMAKDVADLYAVTNAVIKAFNNRTKNNKESLTEFEKKVFAGANNAFATPDEVLTWALTNKDMQTWMESVPYQGKSLWTAFVTSVRRFLGLTPMQDTALSEVLRIADSLLDLSGAPVSDMTDLATAVGQSLHIQVPLGDQILSRGNTNPDIRQSVNRPLDPIRDNWLTRAIGNLQNPGLSLQSVGSTLLSSVLKVTSRHDMMRNFKHMFQNGPQNLLEDYVNTDRELSAFVDGRMVGADKVFVKMRALPKAERTKLHDVMAFATQRNFIAGNSVTQQPWSDRQWEDSGNEARYGGFARAVADMNRMWNDLDPTAKKIYEETIRPGKANSMHTIFMDMVQALEANILDTMEPGESREKAIANVRSMKELVKGDYAPLSRFGDYVVVSYKNDDTGTPQRVARHHFETPVGAAAFKNAQDRTGQFDDVKSFTMTDYLAKTQGIGDAGFIQDFEVALKQKLLGGLDPNADAETMNATQEHIAHVMDITRQFYYEQQPEGSILKHQMHREGTAGFSQDFDRSYASYMMKHARTLGTLRFGLRKGATVRDMRLYLNEMNAGGVTPPTNYDPIRAGIVYNSVVERENIMRTTSTHAIAQALGKYTFFQMLTSPSQYVVQTSQVPMFWLPSMGARANVGFARAAKHMGKAVRTLTTGKLGKEQIQSAEMDALTARLFQKVTPENYEQYPNKRMWDNLLTDAELDAEIARLPVDKQELLAMRIMADRGVLDITQSHDLQQGANDNMGIARTEVGHAMNRALDTMGFVMRHSEFSNRRVALLGTLRINRENGLGFMASLKDSEDLALRTQYDYSRANRQPLMAGNFMKVLTQIQSFRFHSLGFMVTEFNKAFLSGNVTPAQKSEARRVLGYMMFTTSLYAGALGTPIGWFGVGLVNMIMNLIDPDEPFDAAHEADQYLRALGPAGELFSTAAIQKGLPAALGIDLSKRTQLASVFQSSVLDAPEGLTGNRYTEWLAAQMLGPSWTNFSNLIQGGEALMKGDVLEANKKMMPAMVRDLVKTIDVATNGVRGGEKMALLGADEVTLLDYALMAVGLQPTRLVEMRDDNRAILDRNTVLTQRRSKLISEFAKAMDDQDVDGTDEAIEAIYDFNKKQPSFAIGKNDVANHVTRRLKQDLGIQTERYLQIQQQYGYNHKPEGTGNDGKGLGDSNQPTTQDRVASANQR